MKYSLLVTFFLLIFVIYLLNRCETGSKANSNASDRVASNASAAEFLAKTKVPDNASGGAGDSFLPPATATVSEDKLSPLNRSQLSDVDDDPFPELGSKQFILKSVRKNQEIEYTDKETIEALERRHQALSKFAFTSNTDIPLIRLKQHDHFWLDFGTPRGQELLKTIRTFGTKTYAFRQGRHLPFFSFSDLVKSIPTCLIDIHHHPAGNDFARAPHYTALVQKTTRVADDDRKYSGLKIDFLPGPSTRSQVHISKITCLTAMGSPPEDVHERILFSHLLATIGLTGRLSPDVESGR